MISEAIRDLHLSIDTALVYGVTQAGRSGEARGGREDSRRRFDNDAQYNIVGLPLDRYGHLLEVIRALAAHRLGRKVEHALTHL